MPGYRCGVVFQQFESDIFEGNTALRDQIVKLVGQVRLIQQAGGQIDRHGHPEPQAAPIKVGGQGVAQHPDEQGVVQPVMPHCTQERGRQHEAEFKVMPAGKRFRANDMARRQRLLGLEPGLDPAGGQGLFKRVAVK
ncbi:hypothetical protein D3C87_1599880 [compost metagenome]